MRFTFLSLYPPDTLARYLLSSYVLAGYLRTHVPVPPAPDVTILNLPATAGTERICEELLATDPAVVSHSCYLWNIEETVDLIETLAFRGKPSLIHILGGPEITIREIQERFPPRENLFFVIGEGERKLAGLVAFLSGGKAKVDDVPRGVAFWSAGHLSYTEETDTIRDLDEVPSIYLEGVIEDRLYHRKQAFLETQRGCRFKCRYCVYHKNLSAISYYSLPRIYAELDHLIGDHRIYALRIFDSVFTSDLDRAKAIVRHILSLKEKPGIVLPWIYWEFTYQSVDEEFLRLTSCLRTREGILNSYGLPPIDRPQLYSDMLRHYTAINCIGIQSFHPPALRSVRRVHVDRKDFVGFMDLVRRCNLVLKIDIILGLPFETAETFFDGLEFILPLFRESDHILNIHRLQVLPGTELEDLAGEYHLAYSRRAPHLVTSTNGMSEGEMCQISREVALLFRTINSPLRKVFFQTVDATRATHRQVIAGCLSGLEQDPSFRATRLGSGGWVDDAYWNDAIFREVPSRRIQEVLATLREDG